MLRKTSEYTFEFVKFNSDVLGHLGALFLTEFLVLIKLHEDQWFCHNPKVWLLETTLFKTTPLCA